MYKVFPVEGGYEIFWCPSAPTHFNDRIPYDGKIYPQKQAAYRRRKKLEEDTEKYPAVQKGRKEQQS